MSITEQERAEIWAEATAAAYGAAAERCKQEARHRRDQMASAETSLEKEPAQQERWRVGAMASDILAGHIEALTDADATAWLAARDAAQRKTTITEQLGEATSDKESPVWVHGPDGAKGCAYINAHVHARLVREQRKAGADEALAGGELWLAVTDLSGKISTVAMAEFDRENAGEFIIKHDEYTIRPCTIIVSKEGV